MNRTEFKNCTGVTGTVVSAAPADRAAALLQAQSKANELFHAVEARGLIRANVLESQVNQDIYDLAEDHGKHLDFH
jgi:hypothetical protein